MDSLYAALRASGDTISPEVVTPRLLSHPPLHYPDALRDRGVNGDVEYEFVIDTDGRVNQCTIRVVRASDQAFVPDGAAMIGKMRFQPARRDGSVIPILVRQTVSWIVPGA